MELQQTFKLGNQITLESLIIFFEAGFLRGVMESAHPQKDKIGKCIERYILRLQ